ncbi:MAG: sugar phosphate isomerase/epimerase [Clostridia bacterium]|nr:sugar phosphate isomerase/epimerase [Clostridia bacterium]
MSTSLSGSPRLGIGSYAYRYAVGFGDFIPEPRLTAAGFVEEAHRLGFDGVQLCENLGVAELGRDGRAPLRDALRGLGMFVEIGMHTLTRENLERHLALARELSADFLRVVLGPDFDGRPDAAAGILRDALPACRDAGVRIGIENHFDLPTRGLAEVVDRVGSDRVGMVFDTTNGIGFLERPDETLRTIGHRLLSMHVKDARMRKVEAGYLMTGTVLGEGTLDVPGLLRTAAELRPGLSVILEMTIRREPGQTVGDTIVWERDAVERSARELKRLLGAIPAERPQSGREGP